MIVDKPAIEQGAGVQLEVLQKLDTVQLRILLFWVGGNNGETAALSILAGQDSHPPWGRRRPTGACGKGSEVRLRIISDMTFSHHGRRFHQQHHIGNK